MNAERGGRRPQTLSELATGFLLTVSDTIGLQPSAVAKLKRDELKTHLADVLRVLKRDDPDERLNRTQQAERKIDVTVVTALRSWRSVTSALLQENIEVTGWQVDSVVQGSASRVRRVLQRREADEALEARVERAMVAARPPKVKSKDIDEVPASNAQLPDFNWLASRQDLPSGEPGPDDRWQDWAMCQELTRKCSLPNRLNQLRSRCAGFAWRSPTACARRLRSGPTAVFGVA